jgi:hypothetical protein
MKPVKRDQVWEVLRGGGEWCEEHVINVVSNRVNLHFRNDHDPAKGDAIMVAVEEMQNAESDLSRRAVSRRDRSPAPVLASSSVTPCASSDASVSLF